ncbi:I78 family peptidase inhibitor [Marivita sp. S6314]|uniref:I78 family peptidase inhibitor n=1 Tax=Marivita sp. S6314 TaxID=2926406 RepID=UPI001FF0E546|nr:I78 family peptidase inhibitor [Marivita sp. S6314]MCK0150288.1 I78 family peptidase inhibitor [Marivita sp. S6314]
MRFILMFSVCVGLAACQETTAVSSAPPSCGSEEMSHLMGIQRTQLENIAFSQPYRIIPEGSAVTMDFNPARVNFELDQNDAVARIYCG